MALVAGRAGNVEVEIRNMPYKACSCGRHAGWAFDPGADFSTQLFWDGKIATAKRSLRGRSQCARCNSRLDEPFRVECHAQVQLEGFAAIDFRTRAPGFRCASCGLEQVAGQTFELSKFGSVSDGADALENAFRELGLT